MTTCKGCGEECSIVSIDVGIGAFEYWDATGYDSRVVLVSNCCETDFDEREVA